MPKKLTHAAASEIMHAADLTPIVEYPGTMKPWLCRHEVCGREVTPRRDSVLQGQSGCNFCAGNVVEDPEAVMLAAGLVPQESYVSGSTPWLCRHAACGRLVTPTRLNVKQGAGGCKFCGGKVVKDPEAVMLAAGLTPLVDYPGAKTPWLCRHEVCGREVAPWRNSIVSGKGGCRFCAKSGYSPSKVGFFYVAWMSDLDLTGFGISNVPDVRLATYRSEGTLDEFAALFTGTGQEIAAFEAELKAIVKELGEVDANRPAGFKTESLAGDWVTTLVERAVRAGLTAVV